MCSEPNEGSSGGHQGAPVGLEGGCGAAEPCVPVQELAEPATTVPELAHHPHTAMDLLLNFAMDLHLVHLVHHLFQNSMLWMGPDLAKPTSCDRCSPEHRVSQKCKLALPQHAAEEAGAQAPLALPLTAPQQTHHKSVG